MARRRTILGIAALAIVAGGASQLHAAGLQQAIAASQQTGLPLLVLGTSDT